MSVVAKPLDGIKILLGAEIGLIPGDIMLEGAQQPPTFCAMSVVAKRQDGSRSHLVRR